MAEPERTAQTWASHVPVQDPVSDPDDTATSPLPVILPGTAVPQDVRGAAWPGPPARSALPAASPALDAPARPAAVSPLDRPPSPEVASPLDTPGSQRGALGGLPGATMLPRPGPVETPRGPFEPARPVSSVTGSVVPPPIEPPRQMPPEAAAKLDQIKDLYLTAEAIGEDNLAKHFDLISQRQRELIREFFDKSGSDSG
jgi:hypothetical protein